MLGYGCSSCAANEGKPLSDPRIIIEDGVCKLADHSSLVGSIATMDVLVRTMVQKADIPLADAVRMASETPARLDGGKRSHRNLAKREGRGYRDLGS